MQSSFQNLSPNLLMDIVHYSSSFRAFPPVSLSWDILLQKKDSLSFSESYLAMT